MSSISWILVISYIIDYCQAPGNNDDSNSIDINIDEVFFISDRSPSLYFLVSKFIEILDSLHFSLPFLL